MASNPNPFSAGAALAAPVSLGGISNRDDRLPLAVDRARSVIANTLALLRAVQRDPSSVSSTDGRFLVCRDALLALHLEIEKAWFDSQLDQANGSISPPVHSASRSSGSRASRKPAVGKSSLPAPNSEFSSRPGSVVVETSGRSSPLAIAAPTDTEPVGHDDIPEMPGEETIR